jgi:hypothetical protein
VHSRLLNRYVGYASIAASLLQQLWQTMSNDLAATSISFGWANYKACALPCHNRDKRAKEQICIGADGWPLDHRHPANTR